MGLRLVVPPAEEPITLDDAKAQVRVTHDAEDALLTSYIAAARQRCEDYQRRAWLAQTWELTLDSFPCACAFSPRAGIRLPRPPLQSVESVQYVASDGTLTTLDSAAYEVDTSAEPGWIYPAYGTTWPATRCVSGAVRVRYVAGYADSAALPETWKMAVRFEVGHYYANRESVVTGTIVTTVHGATEALLRSDRVAPLLYGDQ